MEGPLGIGIQRRLKDIKTILQDMMQPHLGKDVVLEYIDLLLAEPFSAHERAYKKQSVSFATKAIEDKVHRPYKDQNSWIRQLACLLLVLQAVYEDIQIETATVIDYEQRLQSQAQATDIEIAVRDIVNELIKEYHLAEMETLQDTHVTNNRFAQQNQVLYENNDVSIDAQFLEAVIVKWNLQNCELPQNSYDYFRALMNDIQPYATFEVFLYHYGQGDYEYVLDLGLWMLEQYSKCSINRHIEYILAQIKLLMAKVYLYDITKYKIAYTLLGELETLQYVQYMPEIAYLLGETFSRCDALEHTASRTWRTAVSYYEEGAKAGYVPALLKVGSIYQDRAELGSEHVTAEIRDLDSSYKTAESSDMGRTHMTAETGDSGSDYAAKVGIRGTDSTMAVTDWDKAHTYLLKAAQYGSPEAFGRLGRLYSNPNLTTYFDVNKALQWALKGFDKGDDESLFVLINIFVWGLNGTIEPDYKAAVELIESRSQEQVLFLFLLGKMYVTGGYGIYKDMGKGLAYLEQAAKQGHLEAAYILGTTAASIEMIVPNYEVALYWLRYAASHGYHKAGDALRQVEAQYDAIS